jgi:hypothetical protein
LSDARFVREPDLNLCGRNAVFHRNFIQARGKSFLKSSIAPSTCV